MEPQTKKVKTIEFISLGAAMCKHFVKRKKRFCKMTVAKGKEYCGEHIPYTEESSHEDSYIPDSKKTKRIPCPLDSKHTVYAWNLEKHLKICNAQVKDLPEFIKPGINMGADSTNTIENTKTSENVSNVKLSEIPEDFLTGIIAKVNKLYEEHVHGNIQNLQLDHSVMKEELAKPEYGPETLKHLIQTSSILGYIDEFKFLQNDTSFIEFGAGKGQVAYWLAQAIKPLTNANVILIDRASHRHKKDNKILERDVVHRIRADIGDLDLSKLNECKQAQHIVGVSKHLCGAATDLALRCLLASSTNEAKVNTKGFVIALCCHHRCAWQPFVGKKFFQENQITEEEFVIMTKMVSWAICGSGMSRETRKAIENRAKEGNRHFCFRNYNFLYFCF